EREAAGLTPRRTLLSEFFNYVSAGRKSLADLQMVQIDPCVVHMLLMLFTDHVTLTSFQIDSIEAIETGRWGSSFRCRRFIIISASQAMPCSLLRHPSDQPRSTLPTSAR